MLIVTTCRVSTFVLADDVMVIAGLLSSDGGFAITRRNISHWGKEILL